METSSPAKGPGILSWAVFVGLLFGLAEVALLAAARYLLARELYVGRDTVWMAPLALTSFLALPALLFSVVSRRSPGRVSFRFAAFTFTFLGFLDLILMYHGLHRLAAVVLSAGVASQAAILMDRHKQKLAAVVSYSLLPLLGFVVCLAGGLHAGLWIAESAGISRSTAPPPNAPNVVLIVLDTVRAKNLSAYGYTRATSPNLERIFRTGVVFDNAISTAPWTLPSHATMFTGHFLNELSAHWDNPLDNKFPTLAEIFRARGYMTAGFVANTNYCSYEMGLARGFIHYEDYEVSPGEFIRSSSLGRAIANNTWLRDFIAYHEILGRKTARQINEHFLNWHSRQDSRPFFVFLNYFDAHQPYLPPATSRERLRPALEEPEGHGTLELEASPEEIEREIYAYDAALSDLDSQLGLLMDELQTRGLLQNTLLIITADHGEEFSEHGLASHGNSLYLQALHVPLMISFPGRIPAGRRVRETVSTRDIASTILTLVQLPGAPWTPGDSLARYWNSAETPAPSSPALSEVNFAKNLPAWFPVSRGDMKALTDGSIRYIRNGDGKEELYDVAKDPAEANNLAETEDGRRNLVRLRESMKAVLSGRTPTSKPSRQAVEVRPAHSN